MVNVSTLNDIITLIFISIGYAFELSSGSCAPYGNYTIVNFDGDYCLDAKTPGWGNGDKVQLWVCNGRTEQNWEPF